MADLWRESVQFLQNNLGPFVHLLVPFVILVVGWLVALVFSSLVRRLLQRTDLDNRLVASVLGSDAGASVAVERWTARGVFYLIMVFVLMAFFQTLGLTVLTEPLREFLVQIFTFAPRILSALLLLGVAWLLASLLRRVVVRLMLAARVEERLGEPAGIDPPNRMSLPQSLGNAVYWLVFLVFLPSILEALGLDGLLQPVREMLGKILGFLPNIFASGLLLLVGWFAARIVQRVVTNLLAAAGLDRMGERVELESTMGIRSLSALAGTAIYTLILFLTAIVALDTLEFDAVSGPASQMLTAVLNALPAIFVAVLMLLVAYLVGRFACRLVTDLLTQMGFNTLLARLGIGKEPTEGQRTPSQVAGYLLLLAIVLFTSIEAAALLGFSGLAGLLVQLTGFAGNVFLGIVILGLGLYLANLLGEVVSARKGKHSGLLGSIARAAILVLAVSMGLREMGIANEIINIAFGLLLGALAVAAALAFGLGGREAAGRAMEEWLGSLKSEDEKK